VIDTQCNKFIVCSDCCKWSGWCRCETQHCVCDFWTGKSGREAVTWKWGWCQRKVIWFGFEMKGRKTVVKTRDDVGLVSGVRVWGQGEGRVEGWGRGFRRDQFDGPGWVETVDLVQFWEWSEGMR
jgi:hypothetical protein